MTRRLLLMVLSGASGLLALDTGQPLTGRWKLEPPQGRGPGGGGPGGGGRRGGGPGGGGPGGGGPGGGGPGGQGGGRRGGRGPMGPAVLDLKTEGSKLTGKMIVGPEDDQREVEIRNGRIDGAKFSFSVVQETPRGEMTIEWSGSVDGDTLKGERRMEGFDRTMPFEAKRQK